MRRNKSVLFCSAILGVALLFSGCENNNEIASQVKTEVKEATEDIKENVKEATEDIKEGVSDIVVSTGNVVKDSIENKGIWSENGRYTVKGETDIDVTECDATKLDASVDVGDITVSVANVEQPSIHASFHVSAKKQDMAEEIIENADIYYTISKDTLKVRVVKKGTDTDYFSYLKSHYDSFSSICNFNADIDIKLPESFGNFELSTYVGDITMNDLNGFMNVATDVGDLDGENLMLADGSNFSTDVGDIEVSLGAPTEKGSAKFTSSVGDIDVDVNGQKNEVKKSGSNVVGKNMTVIVGEDYEIEACTDVGSVRVD